ATARRVRLSTRDGPPDTEPTFTTTSVSRTLLGPCRSASGRARVGNPTPARCALDHVGGQALDAAARCRRGCPWRHRYPGVSSPVRNDTPVDLSVAPQAPVAFASGRAFRTGVGGTLEIR